MTGLHPDLKAEEAIVTALCRNRSQTRAAKQLLAFADSRTLPGPIKLEDGRDLVQEAREELADAANYIPWAVAAGQLDRPAAERAAGHLVAAWQALQGK